MQLLEVRRGIFLGFLTISVLFFSGLFAVFLIILTTSDSQERCAPPLVILCGALFLFASHFIWLLIKFAAHLELDPSDKRKVEDEQRRQALLAVAAARDARRSRSASDILSDTATAVDVTLAERDHSADSLRLSKASTAVEIELLDCSHLRSRSNPNTPVTTHLHSQNHNAPTTTYLHPHTPSIHNKTLAPMGQKLSKLKREKEKSGEWEKQRIAEWEKQRPADWKMQRTTEWEMEQTAEREKVQTAEVLVEEDEPVDLVTPWLLVDGDYIKYQEAREWLLHCKRGKGVILCFMERAEFACEEVLTLVAEYLAGIYPELFEIISDNNGRSIQTFQGDEYTLQEPYTTHPLEAAARLAIEDFTILMKEDGRYKVIASASLAPSGWDIGDSIDKIVTATHAPVAHIPPQNDQLPTRYDELLDEIAETDGSSVREDWYIQLREDVPKITTLADSLLIQRTIDFFPGKSPNDIVASKAMVRYEKQVWSRMPASGAILLTTRTKIKNLTDLTVDELVELKQKIKKCPKELAEFKGRFLWEKMVAMYIRERLQEAGRV